MKTKKINLVEYIEANTLRCEASYRGGGIKIDVSELLGLEGAKMTAYQNYLGGGMTGAIGNSENFELNELPKSKRAVVEKMQEALKEYFYGLNNGGGDEYMQENITGKDAKMGYQKLQSLPMSGY